MKNTARGSSYKNPVKSKSNASAIFWAKSEPAIFSRRSRQHKNESLSMARMRIIIQVKPGIPEPGRGVGAGGHAPPRFWKISYPYLNQRRRLCPPSTHSYLPPPPPDLRPSDIQVKLAAKLARSPIIPSRVDPLRPSGPRKYNGNQGRYVNCYFFVCLNGHYQRSQTCKEPYSSIVCRLFRPPGFWTKKVHKYKETKADW